MMRSGFGWVLAAILVLAAPAAAEVCGDADDNGSVTVSDGVLVLRGAAEIGDCELARCDVDGNGSVTVSDGVNVLRAAADLVVLNGCSANALGPRRGFLQTLTSAVVLPGYRALVVQATDLAVAVDGLVSAPGVETLALAQDAWRATRRAWRETEAFRLGPSETLHTAARVDWPAANTDQIDTEVGGPAALSSEYLDTLGAPKVGLQAIEYFLFDPDGGDAAVAAALSGPTNGRRRAYLVALAGNVRDQVTQLRDAWEPTGGDFGADFVNSGIGGTAFPTLKEAFDEVVNRMIFTAENVEEEKLGKPLGVAGGGPRPDLVETARSGDTASGIIGDLVGIDLIYRTALGSVVKPLSAEIDAEVRQQLTAAIEAVGAIPTPLAVAVVQQPDDVRAAYEAVQELRRALTLDVASVLGVTLSFGGTDGD
jgi:predicted lipoprotein